MRLALVLPLQTGQVLCHMVYLLWLANNKATASLATPAETQFFSKAPTTFHGICSVLEIRQPKSDFKIGYPRVAGDICMHFVLLFTVYFRRVYKIFSGVLYLVDFFG